MNLGTHCGRLGGLVALIFIALIAATAANADSGIGGFHSAPPTIPSLPRVPALPGVPALPAVPGVGAAVGATPRLGVAKAHKGSMTGTLTVRVFIRAKSHPKWRPLHKGVHVVVPKRVPANASQPDPNCNATGAGVNCVNLPLAGDQFNSCIGQDVIVNPGSTWHVMNQVFIDEVQMVVTQKLTTNYQRVSGTSADGTTPYQMNDTTKEYDYSYPIAGTTVDFGPVIDENNTLISLGPLPNQIMHVHDQDTVHIDLSNALSPQVVLNDSAVGPDYKCTG